MSETSEFRTHVYALTDKGRQTLQDPGANIGNGVKAVLALIDGVTPVMQFQPFLRALEPLEEKFELLQARGYIKCVGDVSGDAVRKFQDSVLGGDSIRQWTRVDATAPGVLFEPSQHGGLR
jgi:hypothetical protein